MAKEPGSEGLAGRLQYARKEVHKSQREMAKLLGVGFRSWQDYEKGLRTPGSQVIQALWKMGFNANWVLSGVGPMFRLKTEDDTPSNRPSAFEAPEGWEDFVISFLEKNFPPPEREVDSTKEQYISKYIEKIRAKVDRGLLSIAITTVENALTYGGHKVSPEQKASVISEIYDMWAQLGISRDYVQGMVKVTNTLFAMLASSETKEDHDKEGGG